MNVLVRGRNIGVTNSLKEYVVKRVSKLDKFLDGVDDAAVVLVVEGDSHKVEVTIPVNGMILRGEEATGDMYTSIDLVVEKLEKQIGKYKGKLARRRNAGDQKNVYPEYTTAGEEDEEHEGPKVVKTKRFAIKPMLVDEALLQMNLLGHSFYVFSNADTEQVNVVYKRKDGNYGLIEPEF